MTFKAKTLLVSPMGLHLEFPAGPMAVNLAVGKTYLVTFEEIQPEPAPEPPPEKPFAASVVTTQNPWIEG